MAFARYLAVLVVACVPRRETTPPPAMPIARLEIVTKTYCVEDAATDIQIKAFDQYDRPVEWDSDDVDLTTDPPDLARGFSVLSPVKTSLELFNAEITVKAAKTNSALAAAATLQPRFCENVGLEFGGEHGQNGASGADGRAPMVPGGPAGPGGPGRDADPLLIEADYFVGPDGKKLVLVAIASQQGELLRLVAHDPAFGPIKIDATGGIGGTGGTGGWGGDCGRGGDGSHGGNGGRGADVTLSIGDASLEKIVKVFVGGGGGGSSGGGGPGGMSSSNCNYGGSGERGRSGQSGQPGPDGRLKVIVKKTPPLVEQALTTCARCPAK